MQPINIYLVRHGQTFFNKYDRFQGWSDIDLTEKGIADGHRAGNLLKDIRFDAAYSSDLPRAFKTATYILEENTQTDIVAPTPLKAFREQFFGTFEGVSGPDAVLDIVKCAPAKAAHITTFSDLLTAIGADATLDAIHAADPEHDAEDSQHFWTRIEAGFDRLRQLHPDGGDILLVSHGATIRSIAGRFGDAAFEGHAPANGSITKLILTEDAIKVAYYSVTDELPAN
ncbi:histidine phosphatase family protein [Periweissella fabaria]|uniref:2,3-bisphosphoglycerate-dependent phosphoglycerate mutase n=1 Tax=Periweissella fabaria TaxID=546157 RepID=A0ABM8Z609_9LACO|nr:histidine phosphatase family protein [Periweissella fabaria]MCM0597639.1 histidine phosphatase family protein [Periweissella fabaria]CAH0416823.1 2,3-bisphosphoglycerate-dependent phosphoglycerate mutase [Periweissella fabaria]